MIAHLKPGVTPAQAQVVVAVAACVLPARRATSIDILTTIRND